MHYCCGDQKIDRGDDALIKHKPHGYITFSIDDGHPADLKAAELLEKYGFKATFYVPAVNPERDIMSLQALREIANRFEIGSHTFGHRSLKSLSSQEAKTEIENGKKWVEDAAGQEAIAFCYPMGKFHAGTVRLVKESGFIGARTCMLNLHNFPRSPYLWGVSTQAYSHSRTIQFRHGLLEKNFRGVLNFTHIYKLSTDWAEHFQCAVDYVSENGGIAHLYFHSWEIEEQRHWGKLKNVLKQISQKRNLLPMTNGDLFQLWHDQRANQGK